METTRDISAEELAALRDPGARHGAFDRLVGAYLRPLYWHARRLVVVHEDAEDVVQETFLRWLEHYPGQKEREAIPTLYTIARNLCVDLARQRTHLPLRESDRQTPDPTGDWAEKWDLDRLPQEDQTLLLLRYANQVPVQALSKLTGLSRFAIYRKCAKLLAWCKDALREEESP